jgi:hypothetical protein
LTGTLWLLTVESLRLSTLLLATLLALRLSALRLALRLAPLRCLRLSTLLPLGFAALLAVMFAALLRSFRSRLGSPSRSLRLLRIASRRSGGTLACFATILIIIIIIVIIIIIIVVVVVAIVVVIILIVVVFASLIIFLLVIVVVLVLIASEGQRFSKHQIQVSQVEPSPPALQQLAVASPGLLLEAAWPEQQLPPGALLGLLLEISPLVLPRGQLPPLTRRFLSLTPFRYHLSHQCNKRRKTLRNEVPDDVDRILSNSTKLGFPRTKHDVKTRLLACFG